MNAVDLHTHSNKSDGTLSPTELVHLAIQKGLKAFALTDHDNVSGIREAMDAARDAHLSGLGDVEVVPGIEFSTIYQGKDVHIVGLFYDYNDPDFLTQVDEFTNARDKRNRQMCDKMAADGIPISYEKLTAAFPDSVITRAHFGRFLYDTGYISSIKEAFDRLIGDDCPYFIPREKITPQKAVEFLLRFHGIPVLAHPFQYNLGDEGLETLVSSLKEAGLMGIEAYYCQHTPEMTEQIKRLAAKYDLLLSGGSDFHGKNKPNLEMGNGYGHLLVPEECLTMMKHRLHHVSAATKIFFCDFDGTLANSKKEISPATREALDRFVARGRGRVTERYTCAPDNQVSIDVPGNVFVFSSGRATSDVANLVKRLNLQYPAQFLSGYNGAELVECKSGVSFFKETIAPADVRKILDLAREDHIYVHTYDGEEIVVPVESGQSAEENLQMDQHCREVLDRYEDKREGLSANAAVAGADKAADLTANANVSEPASQSSGVPNTTKVELDPSWPSGARYYTAFVKMPIRREADPVASLKSEPCKVLAIHLNNPIDHKLTDFAAKIQEAFPGKFNTILSNPYYLEIDPICATKGYSLTWLCRHLGIPLENSIAAGDAPNDLPMIRAAGTGIGMCNMICDPKEMRAAAQIITSQDNDHDGLAEVLDQL